MKMLALFMIPTLALGSENKSSVSTVYGDETSAPIHEGNRNSVPGDKVVPPLDGEKIDDLVEKARRAWADETKKAEVKVEATSTPQSSPTAEADAPKVEMTKPREYRPRHHVVRHEPQVIRYFQPSGQSITIFEGNVRNRDEETVTLPSGAHAFGRVKFGEEVTADGDSEVLVEMDYAFLGPNQSVVEMNGCVAWIKVKSNFHTQRVKGQIEDMTCTMPNGRVFTVGMEGPLVSATSGYAGVDSDLIMRGPAKAAALKFLGEITSAYGAATAATETTSQVLSASERFSQQTTNITGDKTKYVTGKVAEANGDFLKYISSFFQSMQPTLALPAGTKIHIVNRYNVKIPKIFFKPKEQSHE